MLFNGELRPVVESIKANDPQLTELQLSHKKINDKVATQIADALETNSFVTEVWLCNNLITAAGASYLASALEKNSAVTELYLGGNKIGTKGATSIANLLTHSKTITDVGLEDNGICDGGGKILAEALAHNLSIRTLKLNGNNIDSEQTRKKIKKALKRNKEQAHQALAQASLSADSSSRSTRSKCIGNETNCNAILHSRSSKSGTSPAPSHYNKLIGESVEPTLMDKFKQNFLKIPKGGSRKDSIKSYNYDEAAFV